MKYNLTVHYINDPDDLEGYDDEIDAENIETAKEYVKSLDDFKDIYYYVLESEDGDEYYNSSQEEGFVDRSWTFIISIIMALDKSKLKELENSKVINVSYKDEYEDVLSYEFVFHDGQVFMNSSSSGEIYR